MIDNKAKQGDAANQITITDSNGYFMLITMYPTDDGHDFSILTSDEGNPVELVAHNLVIAASDLLTHAGYPNAIDEALKFVSNLSVDAFIEATRKALEETSDDLPF